MSLQKLFQPRSIAVVGASHTAGKLGHDLLLNVSHGYKGKVYAVNPQGGKILGHSVYRTITEIKKSIDLAIIIVPAAVVCQSVEEAVKVGVRNFVIISAGFSESGEQGKKLQQQLDILKEKYHLRYLGPNCLGFINTKLKLNASFAQMQVKAGNVGLISQSGAMAVATLDLTSRYNLGISTMISIGNKGDLTEIEALDYLSRDKQTEVIALYLEQLSRPLEFLQLAQTVVNRKPIIILKAGVTQSGQRAASSHTGSLAQSDSVVDAGFRQVGIVRAETIEELFSLTQAFSLRSDGTFKNSIVVVSNAGGPAIITTDALQQRQLFLTKLSPTLTKQLKTIVPPAASLANPIDLLGDSDLSRFTKVITAVRRSSDIGALLLLVTPQTMTPIIPLARWLVKNHRRSSQILVTCFLGHDSVREAQEYLWRHNIPSFDYPEQAVRYLSALATVQGREAFQLTDQSFQPRSIYLDPYDSQQYLKNSKLNIVRGQLLTAIEQLETVKNYPIALKVVASGVVHKAASQGVALDLSNAKEARAAWNSMMTQGKLRQANKGWRGFLAQPMTRGGTEFFLGAKRDAEFGTVTIVGIGGGQLELIHDTVLHLGQLSRVEASAMIDRLRNQQLLTSAKRRILIQLLLRVAQLMEEQPKIQELDFNPVLVTEQSYSILDVRIYAV